jgi:hypothetical protein
MKPSVPLPAEGGSRDVVHVDGDDRDEEEAAAPGDGGRPPPPGDHGPREVAPSAAGPAYAAQMRPSATEGTRRAQL